MTWFIVGIAVSQLAARVRRLKVLAITHAGYLAQVQETASLAHRATAPHVVIEQVRKQLIGLLDLRDCVLSTGCRSIIRRGWNKMALSGRNTAFGWLRHAMQGEETELRAISNGQYYGAVHDDPEPGRQTAPASTSYGGHAGGPGARGQAAFSETH